MSAAKSAKSPPPGLGRMMYDARREAVPRFGAAAMGKAIQVSKDTVERWENDQIRPKADQLAKVLSCLIKKGLSQQVAAAIFRSAYPDLLFDIQRANEELNRQDNREELAEGYSRSMLEASQPEITLPKDAEAVVERYWSDPVPDAMRSRIVKRISNEVSGHGWRVDITERGQGCTSAALNGRLVVERPTIKLCLLQESWLAYNVYSDNLRVYALFEARKKPGIIFNSPKIRIASDFFKDGQTEVAIQRTDYLSSVMTDQLAWIWIRSKKLGVDRGTAYEVLWDGLAAFIDHGPGSKKSRLKGLGEATVSNQLGGSTIAISSDGHLMIVAQSDKNRQSINLLAPSGSGSLDWSDVERGRASDLLQLVRFGAERELREESALNQDGTGRRRIASKVMVTGFARMLHRAGKPEFFCLGKIDAPSVEIVGRSRELYVQSVFPGGESANWDRRPRDEIVRVCKSYLRQTFRKGAGERIPMSYPLEHGLKLLIEICQHKDAGPVIDDFILANWS
jgi:DNA-binding XRE family transcriptional regulator